MAATILPIKIILFPTLILVLLLFMLYLSPLVNYQNNLNKMIFSYSITTHQYIPFKKTSHNNETRLLAISPTPPSLSLQPNTTITTRDVEMRHNISHTKVSELVIFILFFTDFFLSIIITNMDVYFKNALFPL